MMKDLFLYFAYGSNMLSKRLKERTPSAQKIGIASLAGYRLTFDKKSKDGSGKCDIDRTENPQDIVWGVIYSIDCSQLIDLDRAEGLGLGYEHATLVVNLFGRQEKVLAYLSNDKQSNLKPYHWYKDIVIAGADEHKLPSAYIAGITEVNSMDDPCEERVAKNAALLHTVDVKGGDGSSLGKN